MSTKTKLDENGWHKAEPRVPLHYRLDPETKRIALAMPTVMRGLMPSQSQRSIDAVFEAVLNGLVYQAMPPDEALAEFTARLSLEFQERGMSDEMVAAFYRTVREIQVGPN